MSNPYEKIDELLSEHHGRTESARDNFILTVVRDDILRIGNARLDYLHSVVQMGTLLCNEAVLDEDDVPPPLYSKEIPNLEIARLSILRVAQYERLIRLHTWEEAYSSVAENPQRRRGFGAPINRPYVGGPVTQLAKINKWRQPRKIDDIDAHDWPRNDELVRIYGAPEGQAKPRMINPEVFASILELQLRTETLAYQQAARPPEGFPQQPVAM